MIRIRPSLRQLTILLFLSLATARAEAQESGAAKKEKPVRTLGIFLFPGFEMLDAAGPLEMWGNLRGQIRIAVIAREKGEIASSQGPRMVAEFGFDDCPPLDLLLIPGGVGVQKVLQDKVSLEWVRTSSDTAELTMSVCNGASILAATGLLNGRPATTNKAYWDIATAPGPEVKWVRQARWVDDGSIVTSSGVSAGMDMTLHVIARLYGQAKAEQLANETEYEWHRDPAWDPFADLPPAKRKKKP